MGQFDNLKGILDLQKNLTSTMGMSEMAKNNIAASAAVTGLSGLQNLVKDLPNYKIPALNFLTTNNSLYEGFKEIDFSLFNNSGLGTMSSMLKGIEKQNTQSLFNTGVISGFKTGMFDNLKSALEPKTISTLVAIGLQHQKLFTDFRDITTTIYTGNIFPKMNNLQWALQGLSGQVASIAARSKQWDLIDDFEEISEEAASISDRVNEQEYISKSDIEEIREFVSRIELKLDGKDKDTISVILRAMTVIGFILALLSEARNWWPKPEAASKNDIEILTKEIQLKASSKLTENKEYSSIGQSCAVSVKPKNNSYIITKLPKDYNVIVLNTNHQWLFISYNNPKDGLTQTGWILKKYLNKTK